jgi:predicted enzyme related to lactoylglutathione lyase
MAKNVKLIVYPVNDLEAAKTLYGKYLESEPYTDSPYYVGYKPTDDLEIGLDPNGQVIIAYIDTDDIDSSIQGLVEAGATISQEPKDVGGGLLIAKLKDADGNVLGLRQSPK